MSAACEYCGQPRELEVLECWPDERAFLVRTCCEQSQEDALADLDAIATGQASPALRRSFAQWFEAETGRQVRGVTDDGLGGGILDWGLQLAEIPQREAKAFVSKHHRHNKPPAGWRWGHAVYNGPDLVAVAMVGRPVARALDPDKTVEINRLCVDPDLPGGLVRNACSMLYGAAAREAKRRGFHRVITYTLETERGTSLRASGYVATATVKGRSWSCSSRRRRDQSQQLANKQRWERTL